MYCLSSGDLLHVIHPDVKAFNDKSDNVLTFLIFSFAFQNYFKDSAESDVSLMKVFRTYSQISADLYSLLPGLVSLTCRVGDVQYVGPMGMLLHVGAAEVMITAGKNFKILYSYLVTYRTKRCQVGSNACAFIL